MLSQDLYTNPVQKYSSFKNEYFNKYEAKIRNMRNNIRQASLKPKDKDKLRKKLAELLMP